MRVELVEKIITALDAAQQRLQAGAAKDGLPEPLVSTWQTLMIQAGEENCLGLVDLFSFHGELLEQFINAKTSLDEDDLAFLSQGVGLLKTFFQTTSVASLTILLDALQNPRWITPVAAEDIVYLQDLLETDRQTLAAPEDPVATVMLSVDEGDGSGTSNDGTDDEDSFCHLDRSLLTAEPIAVDAMLTTMIGEQCALLHQQWQAPANLPELMGQTLEALEPIVRATKAVQLWAGHFTLAGLMKNLQCYQDDRELVTDETPKLLEQSLAVISQYFQDINAPASYTLLVNCFENPEWPYCLSEGQADFLLKLFAQTRLQSAPAIVAELVDADDISLTLPDDVDPQLLDMAFNDLPQLTEDFSKQLQQFLYAQDREALRTAQRVAHTLKGLANMLGVKGIANLTHRLEDILEFLYQHRRLPDSLLDEALIESADALAAMTEALLMRGQAPPMSFRVLQQLANEHYRLQTGGAAGPMTEAVSTPATGLVASQETAESPGREEAFVRVPKALLDQLFRIAGEVKILDTQLDEQFRQIKTLLKSGGERYRTLQRVLADLEQLQQTTLHSPVASTANNGFDPLEMNRLNEMHSSISRLYEAAADSREIERTVETYTRQMHVTVINLAHLHKESLDNILDTRLLAVESMVPRLQRTLRQACRVAGKQAELTVSGADTLIDSQILNQLADPLMHIIRNAVDHGLESTWQRLQAGKPESGRITLGFVEETDMIVVSCEDDGRGINRETIKQIALDKSLIDAAAPLSDQDIDRLILIPGFSTSKTVSQLSGRGIGMDVVHQELIRLKGKLDIASTPGQGCRFTLSIPSSSLLLKATLAQCGQYTVSIIQYGIDKIFLSADGELQKIEKDLWFIYKDERYKAYSIESLVGVAAPNYAQKTDFHLLLVNLGQNEKVVVMVADLLDNRELVFKDRGRYVPHNPAIPGVTILPNGQISPVLDLQEALKYKSIYNQRVMEYVAQTVVNKLPKILVVDDSLSARKSLATLLKDSGYEVATAIDGQDALTQIEASPPDLVITDMEMPRMNGVELTATIKQQRRTAKIPVLMITSRSTDKHRLEASIVGVNAYLTKPWTETELLQHIEALL